MRRAVAVIACAWVAVAVVIAQTGTASPTPAAVGRGLSASPDGPGKARSTPAPVAGREARSAPGAGAADAAKYRAWLNQYCITCHSARSPQPANDPLNLEAANLDDLLRDAATWERVLRKLSVRAMPPTGMPRPQEGEYAAFTSWLGDSLDRAWVGHSTPGLYVIHRLNRAEYRNAIRDLLALDVDIAGMLPNDGGDFGFDNIATALRTSPLLLDGYITAAQRISTMAVGDAKAAAATAEYSINRNVSQNARVDGLPLGTRGGTVVRHIFPADGEYRLFGTAGAWHRRRVRRGRERPTAHVRHHGGRGGSVLLRDWRPRRSCGAGQKHERRAPGHRCADDRPRPGDRRPARCRLHVP
jgi:mono/diheme cytochrome c family protein